MWQPPLELSDGPSRAGSIVMTLVFAVSGTWQWIGGLARSSQVQRAMVMAGYFWMVVAGSKLVAADLDRADTPLRAAAFLGVGAIGMVAAILASRRRKGTI